jgi:uncharacterized protein
VGQRAVNVVCPTNSWNAGGTHFFYFWNVRSRSGLLPTNGELNMRVLNIITLLLVIIGGINWGLVGLLDFDLVSAILGNGAPETATSSSAARVVYILVSLAALYQIASFIRMCSTDRAVAYR